jgi:energy-coupling factor transporter ATP-binding protein EcfA2
VGNLRIKNLQFTYDDKVIFKDVNFTLRKDMTLSIIGTAGSGKTTLLKLFNGELDYNGEIIIDGVLVNKNNKASIACVFKDTPFVNELVSNELKYRLKELKMSSSEIKNRIDEVNTFFNVNKILHKKIKDLSVNDRVLIKILSYAIYSPSYIAIDDLLIYLDTRTKILLLNYLHAKGITLINVTTNMEDVLYTDYILCLYDGINAIDGRTLDVLKNEKVLKRLGFDLPFYYDLSIQLELYGLIKKVYLNKEAMVSNIWK